MATTEDDLLWSENVSTLEEVASSYSLPILVKVDGGSCGSQESESISQGDIFKLDSVNDNQIIGYLIEKGNNSSKQILFNKNTAKSIDVSVCLTNHDEVDKPPVSIDDPPKSTEEPRGYVDFTLPIQAKRTSLEDKPTAPPPVPPREKFSTKRPDEERKPMPPPRKPDNSCLSEPSNTSKQGPKLPDRDRPKKPEIPSTPEEECPDDIYEIPDNIYDDPDDIKEEPTAASPDYSLKHKTKEFFSKLKMKDRMQKLRSKLATAMKREKYVSVSDGTAEEDDEDGEVYIYPDCKSTKNINEKQKQEKIDTQYDSLQRRLTLAKPAENAYTPLHVGGASTADTSFASLSISELAIRLNTCGLNNVADICRKEKVDGRLFLTFTDDDLRELFSVNELQIKKLRMAQNHNWTPKT